MSEIIYYVFISLNPFTLLLDISLSPYSKTLYNSAYASNLTILFTPLFSTVPFVSLLGSFT